MQNRRVVVTGIGIWSCIGTNKSEVSESLRIGRSGIGVDEQRTVYGYHSPLVGIVPKPELKKLLNRRQRICLSEQAEYAYMATREAFEQAHIDNAFLESNEVGVIFGNDASAKPIIQTHEIMKQYHDSAMVGSGLVFQSLSSTATMNLSTIFSLRGVNFSIGAACSSGSHAIGLGAMYIRQGLQDIILCGGAQETNPYAVTSFDALGAFSMHIENPHRASRPFDRERDGLVPSGGAAALVLEEYEHAKARGANILAEIVGYGFSSNGVAISSPSEMGSVRAMKRALEDAEIEAKDIDYVNAHATATLQGDKIEAQALRHLFLGQKAYISSTKSMTGHECWMAGASEIVYSILMMNGDFVAGNINLENLDEEAQGLNITPHSVSMPVRTVLSNSFGFGGTNSALVIRKIPQ